MAFYLYMKQQGEGCDYTIGCAQKLIKLKWDHPDAIKREIMQIFEDYGIGRNRIALANAMLLQDVTRADLDVGNWYQEYKRQMAKQEAEELIQEKRREIERLKREIGET